MMIINKEYKILIADDDPDDRFIMAESLKETTDRLKLEFVEDGTEIFKYLDQCDPEEMQLPQQAPDCRDKELPDMIILDLNMPKMDGKQVLERLKKNEKYCRIPVIVFSTSKAPEDIDETYRLCGNSYLVKPSSFIKYREKLNDLIDYWTRVVSPPHHSSASA